MSLLVLPVIAISLQYLGFRRLQNLLRKLVPTRNPGTRDHRENLWIQAQTVARIAGIAVRHNPFEPSCLSQALTLWWLLLRQGLESQIRLGVHLENSRCKAHAWVEFQDQVLNDQEDIAFFFTPFQACL